MNRNLGKREFIKKCILASTALFVAPALAYCRNAETNVENVDADELVKNIESYVGKNVSIVGEAIHVCPVKGRKLKLKTAEGNIIKVTPAPGGFEKFDKELNGKRLSITGKVFEQHVSRERIEQYAKELTLQCHIDYSACIDSEWVKGMFSAGKAEKYVEDITEKLMGKMRASGKDYVSITGIAVSRLITN